MMPFLKLQTLILSQKGKSSWVGNGWQLIKKCKKELQISYLFYFYLFNVPNFLLAVGLEWDPLSFMKINEELLERKVAAPV
jgi:hypothetical protein